MFIETKNVLCEKNGNVEIDKKLWRKISADLTEYLNKDIRLVSDDFWKDKKINDEVKQKAVEKEPTGQNIETYYKHTKKYLYECTCWESYKSKQRDFKKIYLFLKKSRINNILDFGGGTGGFVIYLSNKGIKCDYIDVEGETSTFAKWRFKKDKLKINVIENIERCMPDSYGAVISDNVFEHLLNLEAVIEKINRILYPGGFLIARSSFGGGGVHLRKNDKYSNFENYDRLMSDKGFNYCGQLKDDFLTKEIDKYIKNYWILGVSLRKRRKYGGNFLVYQKPSKKVA